MGKKNKGIGSWFGKKNKTITPATRTVAEISQDYNNKCVQLGNFVFKTQLAQAQAAQHQQQSEALVKEMYTCSEEMQLALTQERIAAASAPVAPSEGEPKKD